MQLFQVFILYNRYTLSITIMIQFIPHFVILKSYILSIIVLSHVFEHMPLFLNQHDVWILFFDNFEKHADLHKNGTMFLILFFRIRIRHLRVISFNFQQCEQKTDVHSIQYNNITQKLIFVFRSVWKLHLTFLENVRSAFSINVFRNILKVPQRTTIRYFHVIIQSIIPSCSYCGATTHIVIEPEENGRRRKKLKSRKLIWKKKKKHAFSTLNYYRRHVSVRVLKSLRKLWRVPVEKNPPNKRSIANVGKNKLRYIFYLMKTIDRLANNNTS